MALEAVVFPRHHFGCTLKELYSFGGGGWSYDFGGMLVECDQKGEEEEGKGGLLVDGVSSNSGEWDVNLLSLTENGGSGVGQEEMAVAAAGAVGRRKRQRTKSCKNKEEVENQRMTHIAVERNRRKQMNEYLAVLRSIMPASYVQRGDQASIVGGAINFVKELEQLLQSLEAQRRIKLNPDLAEDISSSPFANFFAFPQYSSSSSHGTNTTAITATNNSIATEAVAKNNSAVADIEVIMVESHANLKVLLRRQPKQLLKMVMGLQNLRFTTLHLSVTAVDQMVVYSFNLKVEDDCKFTSVDEIATAVNQIVGKIQEEADFN